MLKIRLMRIGTKKRPFYRVVVVDERAKRTGAYVELLGTYNPLTEPKDIKLNKEKVDSWIKKGAQPSVGYLRMIGKAPQRPPRKPKKAASAESSGEPKEKKEEPAPAAEQPVPANETEPEAKPTEETSKAEEPTKEAPANTSDGDPEGDSSEVSEVKEKEPKNEGSA